jgi:hypothetical protein
VVLSGCALAWATGEPASLTAQLAETLLASVDLSSDLAEAGETVRMLLVLVLGSLARWMYGVPSSVMASSLRVTPSKGLGWL